MRSTAADGVKGGKPTIAHLLPWPSIGGVEIATARIIEATRHQQCYRGRCE